jgi:hypothetical protein
VPNDLSARHNLLMHNMNVVEVVTELLLGQVPILAEHAAAGMVWGAAFIVFSWLHAPVLARLAKEPGGKSRGNGANFPYFFLDWTLPRHVQYGCLLGLISVLLFFYYSAMASKWVLLAAAQHGVPLWVRVALTYGLTSVLLKFRD